MRAQRLANYALPDYLPKKNRDNDYGFDAEEQADHQGHRRQHRERQPGQRIADARRRDMRCAGRDIDSQHRDQPQHQYRLRPRRP